MAAPGASSGPDSPWATYSQNQQAREDPIWKTGGRDLAFLPPVDPEPLGGYEPVVPENPQSFLEKLRIYARTTVDEELLADRETLWAGEPVDPHIPEHI